jgi:hypothetical protein
MNDASERCIITFITTNLTAFSPLEQVEHETRILSADCGSQFLSIQYDCAFCLERVPFPVCVLITKEGFQTMSLLTEQQTETSLEGYTHTHTHTHTQKLRSIEKNLNHCLAPH